MPGCESADTVDAFFADQSALLDAEGASTTSDGESDSDSVSFNTGDSGVCHAARAGKGAPCACASCDSCRLPAASPLGAAGAATAAAADAREIAEWYEEQRVGECGIASCWRRPLPTYAPVA